MAGFPGNNRKLGSAGIPPGAPPPLVTAATSAGADSFYQMGLAFAEDIAPNGASNPPVKITETTAGGSLGGDTFYIMGLVLAESGSPGSSAGMFQATAGSNAGGDTYYILGIVFAEH